jgi:hypothetical protein
MRLLSRSLVPVALLVVSTLHALPAAALNVRSFVASTGSDANSCARAFPCRTLQVAHDKTVAGGEVNMLDVAGYGAVTITKSISIVNDGVGSAGVLVPSGADGITINAGASGDVNLRGLIVEGAGVGSTGIVVLSARTVAIQNSVVRGMVNSGVAIVPTAGTRVAVSDSYVSHNGAIGIVVQPFGSVNPVNVVLNRVQTHFNGTHGVAVLGNMTSGRVNATIVDTVSANNGDIGFWIYDTSCPPIALDNAAVTLLRSTAAMNTGVGFVAEGGCSTTTLTDVTSHQNATAFVSLSSANAVSYGDNRLGFNNLGIATWAKQ